MASLEILSEQLSLLEPDPSARPFEVDVIGPDDGKPRRYTLFLAICPASEAVQHIAHAVQRLPDQHRLRGKRVPTEMLHITLLAIDVFIEFVPQAIVDAAIAAANGVVCPALNVVFDRVLSFNRKQIGKDNAFVLRCDAVSDVAIARLRQSLAAALRRAGLHPDPSNTPHMTMLYDPRCVDEHPIAPICWTATRFALILSHFGKGHHQWIDQWILAGAPGTAGQRLKG